MRVRLFEKTKEKITKYFLPTKLQKTDKHLTDDEEAKTDGRG